MKYDEENQYLTVYTQCTLGAPIMWIVIDHNFRRIPAINRVPIDALIQLTLVYAGLFNAA